MGKPLPVLTSDEAAEQFVDEADLSEYDLSGARWAEFERLVPEGYTTVTVHLSDEDIKKAARLASEEGLELAVYLGRAVGEELRRKGS